MKQLGGVANEGGVKREVDPISSLACFFHSPIAPSSSTLLLTFYKISCSPFFLFLSLSPSFAVTLHFLSRFFRVIFFLSIFFTQTTTPFVSLFLLLFHLIMKDINVFSFFTPSALCVVHTHTHTHTFLSRQKREDLSHPSRPLYVASGKRHLQLNDNASRISCAATFTHR